MHQTPQLRKGGYFTHRCQSKAGVSRKALILLSSSALLGGGASGIKLLDWTGTWSGIEYKSLPNSSQSESSGCQVVWRAQFPRVCISIVHKRQKEIEKGLTYFMADGSSAGKLLFSGSDSTTLFSTFCLQKNKRQLQLKNRIHLKRTMLFLVVALYTIWWVPFFKKITNTWLIVKIQLQ